MGTRNTTDTSTHHAHNINSALIPDRRRMGRRRAVCTAERFDHSRTGRRTRLPVERRTHGHPLSASFNREHVRRSQSAVDDADGPGHRFFNLSSPKCTRYVCNMPSVLSVSVTGCPGCSPFVPHHPRRRQALPLRPSQISLGLRLSVITHISQPFSGGSLLSLC